MEITKLKPQLSFALKQLTAQLQQASHRLTSLGRGVAEKGGRVREALRRRANEFENLLASCRDAIVRTGDKISKFGSRLSRASKHVATPFERAGHALAEGAKGVAGKSRNFGGALRTRANQFKNVLASCRDAIVRTGDKISKFGSRLSRALKRVTAPFERAGNALTRLGTTVVHKGQSLLGAFRKRTNAWFLAVIAAIRDKITRFRSRLTTALKQVTRPFKRAGNTFAGLGKSVISKRPPVPEAVRTEEDELQSLLACSPDAIVVTNSAHRFLATNPKALDLFGVSETNISQFTLDVFFSHGQIIDFDRSGSPFMRRQERYGKCKIRRLDGSSRVAEYVFVANFAPLRHLFRFCDITPQKAQFKFTTKRKSDHRNIQIPNSWLKTL